MYIMDWVQLVGSEIEVKHKLIQPSPKYRIYSTVGSAVQIWLFAIFSFLTEYFIVYTGINYMNIIKGYNSSQHDNACLKRL